MDTIVKHPPRTAMEVFRILPEGTLCEVINNQLYMSPAPTPQHQKTIGNIFAKLNEIVNKNGWGEVYFAPIDVYLNSECAVQPDILFIKKENVGIIRNDGIYGSPDLIVEVLSTNRKHDTEVKLTLYKENRIREYIIVDLANKRVLHYELFDSDYILQGIYDNGKFKSHQLNIEFTF